MNWKNVAFLVSVERKSGRLIRGQRLTRYRENKFMAYALYLISISIGGGVGALVGNFYNTSVILANSPTLAVELQPLVLGFLAALPTIVLLYSIVFTMLSQIQRSGIKTTTQAPYWLPITWQEHTLASVLSNMLGFPLISITGIAAGIVAFGAFTGLIVPAILASVAMVASSFMASAITEVLRILQVRFVGAVYKSTGRAAVWVRFAGSMLFFLVFYIVYFFVVYGSGAVTVIQTIASTQNAAWFVPFVWLGIMLYNFTTGYLLQGLLFMALSLLFIAGLYFLGVWLNVRYGLYEPPAITVTHGVYAPKTGLLGRFGFSTIEAALIRKDLKAFTRRRELMSIFIVPIVFVLVPLFQSIGTANPGAPSELKLFWIGFTYLFPGSIMALSLGNLIIGEEGQAVWRIYAAPFSARSLVKSKYFLVVLFGLIVVAITGTAGALLFSVSVRSIIMLALEAILLMFALAAISLSSGIKGADFNELPRPRMIRMKWGFINFFACALAGLAIIAPPIPYMLSRFIPGIEFLDPLIAVVVSGVVAAVLTAVFYRVSVKYAEELLLKAES
jgi:hypothetical protein